MSKVLVVDDSKFGRTMIKGALAQAGFDYCEAEDGEIAVTAYESESPDVVTMDITMPKKDGIEASEEILRDHPDAKCMVGLFLFRTCRSNPSHLVSRTMYRDR